MALKICLNGSMEKIDTSLHKPVIFLNGAKHRLDEAYTFINGTKYQLWGATGVQIDYITSDGVLNGGDLYAIGEDWMVLNYGYQVLRVDISNLSNPTLIQSATWGMIQKYNAYQSTATSSVFFARSTGSAPYTYNKLSVSNTGGVSVLNSYSNTGLFFMDGTDTASVAATLKRQNTAQAPTVRWVAYGSDYYFNTTLKHTTGSYTSGNNNSLISGNISVATASSTGTYRPDASLQIDSDKILTNLWGNQTNGKGLYVMTESSLTKVGNDLMYGLNILDGNVICRNLGNELVLHDKTSYTQLYSYQGQSDAILFLGKINNHYFVIEKPNNAATLNNAKLVVLSDSDLSVVLTKDLPDDPFNENGGNATFWTQVVAKPVISTTGFLGISYFNYSTLSLRVVRFSDII